MVTKSELKRMSCSSITETDKSSLTDISEINIDAAYPLEKRVEELFATLKNPYCFVCDGIAVKVEFTSGGKSLDDMATDFFIGLKNR